MRHVVKLMIAAFLVVCQANASNADVIFTIENAGPYLPGSNLSVNVFARVDGVITPSLTFSDYSLAIDVGGNNGNAVGPILVSGLTFSGTPLINSPTFANISVSAGATVPDSDIFVNGNLLAGPSGVLTTTNQLLFTLRLNAANNAPANTPIVFSNPFLNDISNNGVGFGGNIQYVNGSISISAVPEPSTYAMIGLGLVAAGGYARFRRGKSSKLAAV